MRIYRSTRALVAVAALALAALGTAQARPANDVSWSLGLSSPGVQLGLTNAQPMLIQQPVYVEPYPVYVQPRPVYVQPRPVYVAPRPIVYVRPAPIFVSQPQYIQTDWGYRGYGRKWKRGHHDGDRDHDRGRGRGHGHDRDDD